MILSASRRTDLPAFYGEWTENRLREGRVLVPNPFRPSQVRDLRFSPETVDCIVFWTKNAGPMLPRLPRIRAMGYSFYFQHTLTPYGPELEPGLANKRQVLADMRRLGEMLGPEGLVWRYDPILTGFGWTAERHLEAFGQLCRLSGHLPGDGAGLFPRSARGSRAPGPGAGANRGGIPAAPLCLLRGRGFFPVRHRPFRLHRPGARFRRGGADGVGPQGPEPAARLRLRRQRGHRHVRLLPPRLPVLLRLRRKAAQIRPTQPRFSPAAGAGRA